MAASSTGKALNVVVNVNGLASSLVNQVMASDDAAKAYSKKTTEPSYMKTAAFKGGITLTGNAKTLTSVATATATSSAGHRTADASAAIGSLALTLKNGSVVLMTLTSTRPTSKASFLATRAGVRTPTGSATITGMTLNSAAFGAKAVKFSGTAKPNTIVFKNAAKTVVVYANRQTITKATNGKASSITVDAISVQLTKFKTGAKTITGNIEIATSIAN
jgi:hypothetical protein